jgi:hypothetical protein
MISVGFQLFAEIEKFVFIAAVASIATVATTLNIQSVYPGLRDRGDRHRLVAGSVLLTLVVGATLLVVSVLVAGGFRDELIWVAATITAGAANAVATAHLVYRGNATTVADSRLTAGLCNLALTIGIIVSAVRNDYALVAAANLAMVAATAVMLHKTLSLGSASRVLSCLRAPRSLWRAVTSQTAAIGAGVLAGVAFHASSLVLPLLGAYSAAWATAIRVSGGISSIGVQILSPRIEATFGVAVRGENPRAVKRLQRAILMTALSVGGACGLGVTIWVDGTGVLPGSFRDQALFLVGVACYCVSAIYFSVGSRLLVMSGKSNAGVVLFGAKAAVAAATILSFDGLLLILVLGVLELVTVLLYSRQLGRSAPMDVTT